MFAVMPDVGKGAGKGAVDMVGVVVKGTGEAVEIVIGAVGIDLNVYYVIIVGWHDLRQILLRLFEFRYDILDAVDFVEYLEQEVTRSLVYVLG